MYIYIYIYILETNILGTHSNGYFHKVNKNSKSIRQPNIQLMLQKNQSVENVNNKILF